VINLATDTVSSTITGVADTPYAIAIDPAGSFAYVTRLFGAKISVIDLSNNTVVGSPITVGSLPRTIKINPSGTIALVSNSQDNTISAINLLTKTVIGSPIAVGGDPRDLVINSAGTYAYVANSSSFTVSEIDLTTYAVTRSLSVGNSPYGIDINSTGTSLYVTNFYGNSMMIAQTTSSTPASASPSSQSSASSPVVVKIDNNLEKSIRFSRGSSTLTNTHIGILKQSVETSGIDATYVVTGTAGLLPGVTDAQVKVLANLRANLIRDYLIKLGVNKANISIEIKITNQGIIPKTKTLANYLTS
jgi:YVTN family beta-propeller protein